MNCKYLYILILFCVLGACNTDCPIQSEQTSVMASLQGNWLLDSVLIDNTKSNIDGNLIIKNDSLQYIIGNLAESMEFVPFAYNSQQKTIEFEINNYKQVKEIKLTKDKSLILKDAFKKKIEYYSKVKL